MKIIDIMSLAQIEAKLLSTNFCGNHKLNLDVFRFFKQEWYTSNVAWFRKSYQDILVKYGVTEDGETYRVLPENQDAFVADMKDMMHVDVNMDGYSKLGLASDLSDFETAKYQNEEACLTGAELAVLSDYLKKQGELND